MGGISLCPVHSYRHLPWMPVGRAGAYGTRLPLPAQCGFSIMARTGKSSSDGGHGCSDFVRGDIGSEAAEASDDREQDAATRAVPAAFCRPGGRRASKWRERGDVEEPGKPAQAGFCLGGEECAAATRAMATAKT